MVTLQTKNFEQHFEQHFDSQRLKDGKEYHQLGLVQNVLVEGDIVTALVEGNRVYRVKIDLKRKVFSCTCPCDFNCKHEAAVFYHLKSHQAETPNAVFEALKSKSPAELIEIIKKMASLNPEGMTLINPDNTNIEKMIKQLWIKHERDLGSFYLKFETILRTIRNKENRQELLLRLLWRLIDLSDHSWNDNEELDDCLGEVLGLLNKELRKMDRIEAAKIKKDIRLSLANFDYLLDYLD